jgi:hypothetical protein
VARRLGDLQSLGEGGHCVGHKTGLHFDSSDRQQRVDPEIALSDVLRHQFRIVDPAGGGPSLGLGRTGSCVSKPIWLLSCVWQVIQFEKQSSHDVPARGRSR